MYTEEQVEQLHEGRRAAIVELQDLNEKFITKVAGQLSNPLAIEYLLHGLCRRLKVIRRSSSVIEEIYPPDRIELLDRNERADLEINLHAFAMNIYGSLDNLAWIFLHEKGISLKKENVGLLKKKTLDHLPRPITDALRRASLVTWHETYAKNYRDALAHRIPLYVPPYCVTPKDSTPAICPYFMHSLTDTDARPVRFHPQMVADIRTVL